MVVAGDGELGFDSERSLKAATTSKEGSRRANYPIDTGVQSKSLNEDPLEGKSGASSADFDPIVLAGIGVMINEGQSGHSYFIVRERKLGARRRSDTVLVSTISDADQGSADVAFRTPLAPYEKSKFLGSGVRHKRDLSLLTSYVEASLHGRLLRGTMAFRPRKFEAITESVNHRVFERKLRPKPYGEARLLGVTNRRPQSSRGYRTEAGLRVLPRVVSVRKLLMTQSPQRDPSLEASSATDRAQVPWKGAPESPNRAVNSVKAKYGREPMANKYASKDEKDFEKRVKECLKLSGGSGWGRRCVGRMRAEQSGPPDRSGVDGGLSRPTLILREGLSVSMLSGPKDGELCLAGEARETLVEAMAIWRANRSSDLGRGGCFVEPSHGIESSKWAIFAGRWSWKSKSAKECVTTHLPNQLARKWMALKRATYTGRRGKSQASMNLGGSSKYSNENFEGEEERFHVSGTCTWPAHPGSGSAVGSSGWKSTAASRGVGAFRPLKIRRTECAHAGRTHNASGLQGLARGLGSGVPVPNPSTVGGLLEPLTWRERTASCRPGDGLGTALSGAFPGRRTANSELKCGQGNPTCSDCLCEEIQPSAAKPQPRSGLGRISGKEDPVELDSMRIRTVKAWPIDPLDLEFEARGVRKVTTGITGLIHQVLDCSPTNRERELGLDRRETVRIRARSGASPAADCRPSVGAGSQRRVSLAKSVPLMCTSLGQKHLAGALTPKELSFTVVSTATTAGKDLIEPASVKLETIMDHYCPKTVHGKGQRADMFLVAKITEQSTGRASVPICVLMYCPRGEKHRTVHGKGERAVMRLADSPRGENHPRTVLVAKITHGHSSWRKSPRIVHGKGQRADMRTGGQSSWRKSPTDSPRGENHPRTVLVAKITADSPREGPAC
ncbi:hypothetical protein Bca101_101216 [Brassica carinata]